jgi:hypothetical protein
MEDQGNGIHGRGTDLCRPLCSNQGGQLDACTGYRVQFKMQACRVPPPLPDQALLYHTHLPSMEVRTLNT